MGATIPFPQNLDIPQKDFELFVALNANVYEQKQTFYLLKDAILRRYGRVDGYDLQTIVKTCWSCEGTGRFTKYEWGQASHKEPCWSCGATGIYSTANIMLQRYILNDRLFHKPTDAPIGICANKIDGLCKHEPVPSVNNTRALDTLLDKYAELLPLPVEHYRKMRWHGRQWYLPSQRSEAVLADGDGENDGSLPF